LHRCPTGKKTYYSGPSQKDEQSILTYVGSPIIYTVDDARTKSKCFDEGKPLGTIHRKFKSSMRIGYVVLEYLQETDPHCPGLLEALFDCSLVPNYGDTSLSGIDTERWLTLIKEASKDPITCKFLHRNARDFLSWAVKRQLLRRNPLSGTSVVKPASLVASDGSDRLLRLFETPTVTDSTAKSPDSIPNGTSAHEISQKSEPETTVETPSSASA
jgi:hypothetical protein